MEGGPAQGLALLQEGCEVVCHVPWRQDSSVVTKQSSQSAPAQGAEGGRGAKCPLLGQSTGEMAATVPVRKKGVLGAPPAPAAHSQPKPALPVPTSH